MSTVRCLKGHLCHRTLNCDGTQDYTYYHTRNIASKLIQRWLSFSTLYQGCVTEDMFPTNQEMNVTQIKHLPVVVFFSKPYFFITSVKKGLLSFDHKIWCINKKIMEQLYRWSSCNKHKQRYPPKTCSAMFIVIRHMRLTKL